MFSTNGAAGVSITGANNVLEANFIGTDSAGDNLGGGQNPGVVVAGAGNTIGGNGRRRRQHHRLLVGGRVDHRRVGRAERRAGELHRHECPGSLPRQRTRRGDRRRIEQQGGRDRPGAGNTIAFNAGAAVAVQTGVGNAIRENLIYGNGSSTVASGIVLANGGNDNAPAPNLAGVLALPSGVQVYLQTAMPVGTVLDFFASTGPVNAGGPVQAQIFVGTQTVTTERTDLVHARDDEPHDQPGPRRDGDLAERRHLGVLRRGAGDRPGRIRGDGDVGGDPMPPGPCEPRSRPPTRTVPPSRT